MQSASGAPWTLELEKSRLPAWEICLSVLLQASSFLRFFFRPDSGGVADPWLLQFAIAIAASILLTIAGSLMPSVRGVILATRVLILMALTVPLAESIGGIKLPLLFAIYLDIGFGMSLLSGLAASAVSTVMLWGPLRLIVRWSFEPLAEVPIDLSQVLVYSGLLLGVTTYAKVSARREADLRRTVALRDESIKDLTDANTGFQRYLRVAEENSKTDERNRIIRELHDSIGYTLTTIIMLSESGLERAKLVESDRFTELFEPIRENAKDCLTDVRIALRLMKARKDSMPDTNALLRLVRAFEKATRVEVELNFGNVPAWFGEGIDSLAFRVIQEGLVNAFRHGRARRIVVGLWIASGSFHISLRDDGTAGGQMGEGLGISGIRERVEAAGGSLGFKKAVDGFLLSASFPYPAVARAEASEDDR